MTRSATQSELRTSGRQRRGLDAFAHRVAHRHVAVGVKRNRPDSVVVIVRPTRRGNWAAPTGEIAREQRIHRRWDVIMLPRQQHGLVGELAAGEEKTTG